MLIRHGLVDIQNHARNVVSALHITLLKSRITPMSIQLQHIYTNSGVGSELRRRGAL
jgi:hypothetical protein